MADAATRRTQSAAATHLTHLLFPDSFERISTVLDKWRILAAFGDTPEKELKKKDLLDVDRALLDLRRRLEAESGGQMDFYEDQFAKDWRNSIRSWLLSWNPTKWDWATLVEDRAKTRGGGSVTHSWRCASISPREGDHVYLVRTGVDPRGIVAFGTVARTSYEAPHYEASRAEAGETSRIHRRGLLGRADRKEDPITHRRPPGRGSRANLEPAIVRYRDKAKGRSPAGAPVGLIDEGDRSSCNRRCQADWRRGRVRAAKPHPVRAAGTEHVPPSASSLRSLHRQGWRPVRVRDLSPELRL